jgi:hypothetical protein
MITKITTPFLLYFTGFIFYSFFPLTVWGQGRLLQNIPAVPMNTRPEIRMSQRNNVPIYQQTNPPVNQLPVQKSQTVQPVQPAHWHGLLFAVEQYDKNSQKLSPLRGCYNDMIAVKTDWFNRIGMKDDQIVFLNDRSEHSATLPTRRNFLTQLDQLCRNAGTDSNLAIIVSSHGIAKDGKSYVCPSDAVYQTSSAAWDNLIAVSDIIMKLKSSKANRKLLIIDACRTVNDGAGKEDFMNEFVAISKEIGTENNKSSSGLAVISSCSLAQEAHEMMVNGLPRGVFMKYFIEGLTGPADYLGVIDGNITLSEAHAYAFAQTSKFVYLCRNRQQQTPELFRGTNLTTLTLARSEPLHKQQNETNMQFLLRQSLELTARGMSLVTVNVLSHIIANEPNNHVAVACRAGVFLSLSDYHKAMEDYTHLGRTLDLYVQFSPKDAQEFQRELNKLTTRTEQEEYVRKNRKVRILADKKILSAAKAELEPGQKVSISKIDGNWYYVSRIDDNITQNQIGWIHQDNLTWSPEKVEQYRPQTEIHNPDGAWREKIGGLNFRQQSGAAGGGSGRAVIQRTIGGGSI